MPDSSRTNYLAFLVRLWRSNETTEWRVLLHDPHSGQLLRFDSIDGLYVFLQTQLGEPPRVPTPLTTPTNQTAAESEPISRLV